WPRSPGCPPDRGCPSTAPRKGRRPRWRAPARGRDSAGRSGVRPPRPTAAWRGPTSRGLRGFIRCDHGLFDRPVGRQDSGSDGGGPHKVAEQWMRAARSGAELRMKLRGHEPGMVPQLDDLHQPVVGRGAGEDHARLPHRLAIGVVEFEAMAMPFIDHRLTVGLRGQGAGLKLAGVEAEPHGPALLSHVALLREQVDDRMAGERVELRAIRVGGPEQVATELDDRALHTEAQPEIWNEGGPGEARRGNFPLDAAMTESARDHDAVDLVQRAQVAGLQRFGGDPLDVDAEVVVNPGMPQRF